MLHWRIDEFFDFGERNDLIELAFNFPATHTEDCAIKSCVFPPGKFGMKAGSHLEERTHSAMYVGHALCRLRDAGEDFKKRALPRSISADNANDLASIYVEGNIPQSPE